MKKLLLMAVLALCSYPAFASESSYTDDSNLLAQNQMPVWQKYANVKVLCNNSFYNGTVYICRQNYTTYMKLKVNGQEFTDIETCSYHGRHRGESADTTKDGFYNFCAGGKYYFYL